MEEPEVKAQRSWGLELSVKLDENYKPTGAQGSMNFKQNRHQKTHTKAHHAQIANKKILKAARDERKITWIDE